jgi:papain like cysteine protease AvrRpt2
MALRTTNGISVAAVSPAPGLPAQILLPVPFDQQEQTNWCWAGCCEMVFQYNGVNNVSQCGMATQQFGGNCCASPSSPACNQGNWPENVYPVYGFKWAKTNGAFPPPAVQQEIGNQRPLEVYYAWNGGGAHVALIIGYYANGDLEVNDPWYGPGRRAYSLVLGGYGLGAWTMTYYNLGK